MRWLLGFSGMVVVLVVILGQPQLSGSTRSAGFSEKPPVEQDTGNAVADLFHTGISMMVAISKVHIAIFKAVEQGTEMVQALFGCLCSVVWLLAFVGLVAAGFTRKAGHRFFR
jgi:hypothetical protein